MDNHLASLSPSNTRELLYVYILEFSLFCYLFVGIMRLKASIDVSPQLGAQGLSLSKQRVNYKLGPMQKSCNNSGLGMGLTVNVDGSIGLTFMTNMSEMYGSRTGMRLFCIGNVTIHVLLV